jgi:hypothetical protein
MSLLTQATQTASDRWIWSANDDRFTLRSAGHGIYDYFTPTFRGDLMASVAGANVRVTAKTAAAARILDIVLPCLLLIAGGLAVDLRQPVPPFIAAPAFLAAVLAVLGRPRGARSRKGNAAFRVGCVTTSYCPVCQR